MSTITDTIATLEQQDAADAATKYVHLVVDVGNDRITDPAEIHATLRVLGRDAARLNADLAHYRRVRSDFDLFLELPAREEAKRAADAAAERHREQVRTLRADMAAIQAQLTNAEHAVKCAEAELRNADNAVTHCKLAGSKLTNDPNHLQFLPDAWQTVMGRVRELQAQAETLEQVCALHRDAISQRARTIATRAHERAVREKNDWNNRYNPPKEAARKTAEDREWIANASAQIDQLARDNDTTAAEHNRLAAELLGVRSELADARAELSRLLAGRQ